MSTAQPRIAYVVINYFSAALLEINLRLAAAELGPDSQVVVIDNSGEANEERVPSLALFPQRRVIANTSNLGFSAGLNQALRVTDSDLVLLANPDTFLRSGCVATLVTALMGSPGAAVAGPRVLDVDGEVQGSARRFPSAWTGVFGRTTLATRMLPRNPLSRREIRASELAAQGRIAEVDWVSGACMLLRRKDLDAVGGFDERFFLYWEDADICFRLAECGRRTIYVPHAQAVHLGGSSSSQDPVASVAAFHRSAYQYFFKNCAPDAGYLARATVGLGLGVRAVGLGLVGLVASRVRASDAERVPRDRLVAALDIGPTALGGRSSSGEQDG